MIGPNSQSAHLVSLTLGHLQIPITLKRLFTLLVVMVGLIIVGECSPDPIRVLSPIRNVLGKANTDSMILISHFAQLTKGNLLKYVHFFLRKPFCSSF